MAGGIAVTGILECRAARGSEDIVRFVDISLTVGLVEALTSNVNHAVRGWLAR
jgi:hypothetical protein